MARVTLLFVVLSLLSVYTFFPSPASSQPTHTVLQILQANFTTFYSLVSNITALTDILNTTQGITVFAPSNAAFNSITIPTNLTVLTNVLSYHISTNAEYFLSGLTDQITIPTVLQLDTLNNGHQVLGISNPSGNNPTINGNTSITEANITGTNGVVQAISSVLLPPSNDIFDVLGSGNFGKTRTLLSYSNVSLSNSSGYTFIAATDNAWAYETAGLYEYLILANVKNSPISNQAQQDLDLVVEHMTIPTVNYTDTIPFGSGFLNTLNGQLSYTKPANWPAGSIVLNSESNITVPNILASNGVAHGIDDAILPTDFTLTLEKLCYGLNVTTFLQLANSTGVYSNLLNDSANRSLFVPSNNAFNGVNVTAELLMYHSVGSQLNDASFNNNLVDSLYGPLTSLLGGYQKLNLTTEKSVNGTSYFDLVNDNYIVYSGQTTNGNKVYLIGSVLTIPQSVPAELGADNFTALANVAGKVPGLLNTLTTTAGVTLFAPTDAAFSKLANGTVGYLSLNNSDSQDALSQILLNHAVVDPVIYYTPNIGNTSVKSLTGNELELRNYGGGWITVNNAKVVVADVLASNGVVQGIDEVLVPSNVTFNLVNILEGLGNFQTLLQYLNSSDLLNEIANSPNITLFAPNDEAFTYVEDLGALEGNSSLLRQVLLTHLVNASVPEINASARYYPANGDSNQTLVFTEDGQVELENDDGTTQGTANIVLTSFARNGTYLYELDRVLGVPQEESSSGGLKGWQIALIVIGSVVVALLVLAIIGVIVFFVFFKNKPGYRRIDD